jgi:formate dehydrogenase iron-sulfur subunit
MTCACLVDTTRCIGCRSCQVACKQANGLEGEETKFFAASGGYQNPSRFSPNTRTYVSYHEVEDGAGGLKWVFVKLQCMHCKEMPCANVCAPEVFRRTASGVVVCDSDKCIGCVACEDECPFQVPTIEYRGLDTPHVRKCDFCFERLEAEIDRLRVNGKPLAGEALRRHKKSLQTPACAKACPTGAIQFGDRPGLLAEARRRIAAQPDKYVDHVYGEKELGGLGWLYLAGVPFEKLGLPTRFAAPEGFQGLGAAAVGRRAVASLCGGIGTLLAGLCWFFKRREEVRSLHGKRLE